MNNEGIPANEVGGRVHGLTVSEKFHTVADEASLERLHEAVALPFLRYLRGFRDKLIVCVQFKRHLLRRHSQGTLAIEFAQAIALAGIELTIHRQLLGGLGTSHPRIQRLLGDLNFLAHLLSTCPLRAKVSCDFQTAGAHRTLKNQRIAIDLRDDRRTADLPAVGPLTILQGLQLLTIHDIQLKAELGPSVPCLRYNQLQDRLREDALPSYLDGFLNDALWHDSREAARPTKFLFPWG